MAEDQDQSQKTEEPTQKKLDEAHKKGDVAKSQEVRHWFALVSAVLALTTAAGWSATVIREVLAGHLANMHGIPADGMGILAEVKAVGLQVFGALALPLGIIIVGALMGGSLQHKPVLTFEKMIPKFSKISPLAGLKRLFSGNTAAEFGKITAKFAIVAAVGIYVVWPDKEVLPQLVTLPAIEILSVVYDLVLRLLIGVVSVMTIIAIMDFMFQKFQHTKRLRMTKQEVKDENKQLEGDPQIKARIRQLRSERARQRVATAVPESDVIITNPTHYAVALQYRHGEMEVPVLKAKGIDYLALRIREIAEEHGIPIVENPPLARALFATVEVDEEVPPKHYKAVADVIGYILKLGGRNTRPPKPGAV